MLFEQTLTALPSLGCHAETNIIGLVVHIDLPPVVVAEVCGTHREENTVFLERHLPGTLHNRSGPSLPVIVGVVCLFEERGYFRANLIVDGPHHLRRPVDAVFRVEQRIDQVTLLGIVNDKPCCCAKAGDNVAPILQVFLHLVEGFHDSLVFTVESLQRMAVDSPQLIRLVLVLGSQAHHHGLLVVVQAVVEAVVGAAVKEG